jgi:hypothetical protein
VVVMPQFAAPHPRKVRLRAIGAGIIHAVALLMVDPLHREFGMERIPGRALVGVNLGSLGDPSANEGNGVLAAVRIRAYPAAAGRERRKFSGCRRQLGFEGFRSRAWTLARRLQYDLARSGDAFRLG